MDAFDVRIWFMDGSEETVPKANHMAVENGALHIYNIWRGSSVSLRNSKHLGSYPIHNIRKWVKE